jgi:phenylalanyl-tRNA synthetase alpha chain
MSQSKSILSPEALERSLAVRDLTDPAQGPHVMQVLLGEAIRAPCAAWRCEPVLRRAAPVVSAADNWDRLGHPAGGAARDARHSRWVSATHLLRTQTSAMIPPLLHELAEAPPTEALLACPGLVWRRDAIDRLHCGEPHQVDLWRIRRGEPLGRPDLVEMVGIVLGALLPGRAWRVTPASHPYTQGGLQIDVREGDGWVEVGECGLASRALLAAEAMPSDVHGLAMGLGLDRILMLRKGLPDIRLLRSDDPRVLAQMQDLAPWRPVSREPATRRDLSLAVAAEVTPEELGDRVREALGAGAAGVEAIEVREVAYPGELSAVARARLGIQPGQKNVLLRLVLRDLTRTLTSEEANRIRDQVYAALHEGTVRTWAREDRRVA